jgi:hypothetical protein
MRFVRGTKKGTCAWSLCLGRYSQAVRAKLKVDLQTQQKKIKDRMRAIERAGNKKIKRGRR